MAQMGAQPSLAYGLPTAQPARRNNDVCVLSGGWHPDQTGCCSASSRQPSLPLRSLLAVVDPAVGLAVLTANMDSPSLSCGVCGVFPGPKPQSTQEVQCK